MPIYNQLLTSLSLAIYAKEGALQMEGLVDVVNALTLFRVPPSPKALELTMFALLGEWCCRFRFNQFHP